MNSKQLVRPKTELSVFDICKKIPKSRSKFEIEQVSNFMTKNFAVFASIKDSDQLNTILSKLEPKIFEEGEFIMKFGQRDRKSVV